MGFETGALWIKAEGLQPIGSFKLRGAFNKIAGFAIGLSITMGALFGGPFTGAALNPARAFGPALAANHWTNHGVYWIGPLAGGIVAGWLYDTLFLGKKQELIS